MKKLIVTGLSGLVGSKFRELYGNDFELIDISIETEIDITNASQIDEVFSQHADAEAVIHLAAFTNVSAAYEQTDNKDALCWQLNFEGTRNIVNACKKNNLYLIHISTDFVFDGEKDGAYSEADSPSPIEWYGLSKFEAEKIVSASDNWAITRIAFPYCAAPAPKVDAVRFFLSKLQAGESVQLFTDQIITPTWVNDIAAGLNLLVHQKPQREIFHLVGSNQTTPFELGILLCEVFDLDKNLVQPSSFVEYLKKDPRPRQRALHLSNEKWCRFAGRHHLSHPAKISDGLLKIQ